MFMSAYGVSLFMALFRTSFGQLKPIFTLDIAVLYVKYRLVPNDRCRDNEVTLTKMGE